MKKKSWIIITAVLAVCSIAGIGSNKDKDATTAYESTTYTKPITYGNSDDSSTNSSATTKSANTATTASDKSSATKSGTSGTSSSFDISSVPAYSSKPYVTVNGNQPYFTSSDYTTKCFETYSKLDSKGRCGVAYACVGTDLMPTEKRGNISSIKPTGWKQQMYDFVDGEAVYNRCHLIGYQLSGENANERNLITGTRYMNTKGMLPFENMVADYVKETDGHVMYRVTPIFEGSNLVATGVLMEAYSVEDDGDSVCYCVFCYNVQPGVTIDYATGENHAS